MKKLGLILLAVIVVFTAIFLWLLSGASPENAPQDEVVIELPDTFEK